MLLALAAQAAVTERIRFAPPVFLSSGDSANGVVVADLNGDGKLDLVVINKGADLTVADRPDANVAVMLGNGDGTFAPAVTYAIPNLGTSWPLGVAVADLDGDGKRDVAVALALNGISSGNVLVYLGNGDGTLKSPVSFATGISPMELKAIDLNGDAKTDLLLGGNGTEAVLLNNGDGTFRVATLPSSNGCLVFSVEAADFNADARLDLAATCSNGANPGGSVLIYIQKPDRTFQTAVEYVLNDFPNTVTATSVITTDLNGDSRPDLIVAESLIHTAQVLLGNSDGTFTNTTNYYAGTGPAAIGTADFNGDGTVDVAFADSNFVQRGEPVPADDFGLTTFEGNGDGTLDSRHTFAQWGPAIHANAIAVADLNGDGAPDVVLTDSASGKVAVMLNARAVDINLTATPSPAEFGEVVTFTAEVLGTQGQTAVPTGTVDFYDYTTLLGSATLDATGAATFTWSFSGQTQEPALPRNYHLVAAAYAGDASFVGSWSNYFLGVGHQVTVNFTAVPNPAAAGQTVTLTAQVSSSFGTPTGSVLFWDGDTVLKSVKVSGDTATLSKTFSNGHHALRADFVPDNNSPNYIAGDATLTLNVESAATTVKVSAPSPITAGTAVQISATVSSSSSETPAGSVEFFDNSTSLGTAALANATAALTVTLGPGTHSITARYGGDTSFAAATSVSSSLVVNPIATTVTLTGPNSSAAGATVTLTATVSSSSGTPAGNVVLLDNKSQIAVAPLGNGTAMYSVQLAAGSHSFNASYQGAGNFGASSSATVALNVPPDFTMASSVSRVAMSAGGSATATITIAPLPGGFGQAVQFACSGLPDKSSCSFSPASVTPGSAAVTSTLTISTTATVAGTVPLIRSIYAFALLLPMIGSVLLGGKRKHRRMKTLSLAFVLAVGIAGMASCGGGSSPGKGTTVTQPGTPSGAYTVLVTAQSGATQHQTSIALTVQ